MKVCLVLSGSGMNIDAHVGALHAILDAGHEITHIVGVSGGGLVAGAYAVLGPHRLKTLLSKVDYQTMFKKRSFIKAIFSGYLYSRDGFEKLLRDYFNGIRFSGRTNWPHVGSLTILASDVERGKVVVFSSAPLLHNAPSDFLVDAMLATSAAPIIFPSHIGLFDGGLVNNIPIDFVYDNYDRLGLYEDIYVIGVRAVAKKKPFKLDDSKSLLKIIDVSRASVQTLLTALDREHVEENVQDVCFVPCCCESFNFEITMGQRSENYVKGYSKMQEFLKKFRNI